MKTSSIFQTTQQHPTPFPPNPHIQHSTPPYNLNNQHPIYHPPSLPITLASQFHNNNMNQSHHCLKTYIVQDFINSSHN